MQFKRNSFTLAETLLTLAILGIVAAITIPTIMIKHKNSVNRSKFKKAIQVYNTAINSIAIEMRINSNAKIQTQIPLNNCSRTSQYFAIKKVLSSDNGTSCRFMTGDGIYWDISNIQKVIVALDERDLNTSTADSNTNRAFYMISDIDPNGILRVNDILYEDGSDKTALVKLYDYINGKTKYSDDNVEIADNNQENNENENEAPVVDMENYCDANNTYSCIAKTNNDVNACPTFACKYQLGAWAEKTCPAELAVKDLRDCQRCKTKENLCDVFDENGFHRLKIYNCKANYTECKTIQERNDNDKTITQIDYNYKNGEVLSYSEKRLKDDGKTLIKLWSDCSIETTYCSKLTEYYDNGKTAKLYSVYDKNTGFLRSTNEYNSNGRDTLTTFYKDDGKTLDYYNLRIYDETGTKNLYKKEGCRDTGICDKYYIYVASGENYTYKYEYKYYNTGKTQWLKEYTDDGSRAVSTTYYDASENITKIDLYGSDGKTVVATKTNCNSSGVCASCTGTGCP